MVDKDGKGTRRRVQSDMLNVRLPRSLKQEIERRSQAQGIKVSEAVRYVLQAEAAGILAWAVAGCLDWQREGLGSQPAVQEATETYRLEQDRLGQFLADCTVTGPQGSVRAADLYRAYERWCRDSGDQPMSGTAFGRQMAERGVTKTRDRTGMRYQGLALALLRVGYVGLCRVSPIL